jgi:hypothetical protein
MDDVSRQMSELMDDVRGKLADMQAAEEEVNRKIWG